MLAWELGSNHGHIAKLVKIAEELILRGHHISFVLKDPLSLEKFNAASLLENEKVELFQAPYKKMARTPDQEVKSLPEILFYHGFATMADLSGLLEEWLFLFDKIQPDIAIAEYAPSLLVASRSKKWKELRCIVVENGFGHLPPIPPGPYLALSQNSNKSAWKEVAESIVKVINSLAIDYNLEPLEHLGDLFAVEQSFITTIPELDFYPRPDSCHTYVGNLDSPSSVSFGESPTIGKTAFAYLRPESGLFFKMLDAFKSLDIKVHLYAPGLRRRDVLRLSTQSLLISTQPLNTDQFMKNSNIVVHHGGIGILTSSLLEGIPNLIAPTQLEQENNAAKLAKIGCGLSVSKSDSTLGILMKLKRLLSDLKFQTHANQVAQKYVQFKQTDFLKYICDYLEQ